MKERGREGGREGTHRTHTYPDTRATRTASMHGSSDEMQRDVELGGAAHINSHSPVARHIHGKLSEFCDKVQESVLP